MTDLMVQPLNTAAVSWNKAELAAAVMEIASRYAGLVVIDKATAKRDRAEINRMLRQIDDARKDVKRKYEAPLKAFEADVREIVEPLKEAGAAIDAQIKAIEDQERADKRAELVAAFAALGAVNVPFERVYNPAWLNAGTSIAKATAEMEAATARAEADIAIICGQHSPHEAAMLDKYYGGATLAEVLAYAARLDAQVATTATTVAAPEGIAQPVEDNPLNVYTLTADGVVVTARQDTHNVMITCSPAMWERVCALLDGLGVFYVAD